MHFIVMIQFPNCSLLSNSVDLAPTKRFTCYVKWLPMSIAMKLVKLPWRARILLIWKISHNYFATISVVTLLVFHQVHLRISIFMLFLPLVCTAQRVFHAEEAPLVAYVILKHRFSSQATVPFNIHIYLCILNNLDIIIWTIGRFLSVLSCTAVYTRLGGLYRQQLLTFSKFLSETSRMFFFKQIIFLLFGEFC